MTAINPSRVGGSPQVGAGGRGPSGSVTSQTLNAVAADVAATIARELGLAADADGRRNDPGHIQDLYGIEQIATDLAKRLGASPREAGEIVRLLHLFAAEVAARVGAVPDARSVDVVARLVRATASEGTDAGAAIQTIQRAVRDLAA